MDIDTIVFEANRSFSVERGRMVRRGMLARARAGLPLGRLPLGYQRGVLAAVLSEPAASVIRNVFIWIGDEGVSVAEARRRAEESGLRDTSGAPLTAASFLRLVRNPFYAGYVRGFDEIHDGMHERLINPDTFRRANGSHSRAALDDRYDD